MQVRHGKHLSLGIVMAISFFVVLFLIFSPLFPIGEKKVNGLEWSDEMFNRLAKGSSYFIPKVAKSSEKFKGRMFSATIRMDKPEDKPGEAEKRAERSAKVLASAGAQVEVKGAELKIIQGDLGQVLEAALQDADTMFNNEGGKIKTKYAYDDEKQMFRQWNNTLPKISKQFEKEKKMEEAKIITDVVKKAIEPSYNFYSVKAVEVKDHIVLMTFLLVFYVVYTMWWGFSIFYVFEGLGLSMKKAKAKKEV
jgi:hypothetical protein